VVVSAEAALSCAWASALLELFFFLDELAEVVSEDWEEEVSAVELSVFFFFLLFLVVESV